CRPMRCIGTDEQPLAEPRHRLDVAVLTSCREQIDRALVIAAGVTALRRRYFVRQAGGARLLGRKCSGVHSTLVSRAFESPPGRGAPRIGTGVEFIAMLRIALARWDILSLDCPGTPDNQATTSTLSSAHRRPVADR